MKTTTTGDSGNSVLSASGAAAAVNSSTTFVHELNQNPVPHSVAAVNIGGTFTSAVTKIDVLGPSGTLWVPARFIKRNTGAGLTGSDSPTNSTNTGYLVDTRGASKLRVYNSSGTITSQNVEVSSGEAGEFGGVLDVSDSLAALNAATLADGSSITNTANATGTYIWGASDKGGFFGATPVVKQATFTQTYSTAGTTVAAATTHTITDSTGGTASTSALVAISGTYVQSEIRNNLATLAAEDALLAADIVAIKKNITSIIDALQAYGLVG